MMSRINSRHWKYFTDRHFQNGRHNTTKIQHCPISSNIWLWVDYDVPNKFSIWKHFYRAPFSKSPPQYRTNSILSDFNNISHVGRLWCPDIEQFLAVAIFKMAATIRTNITLCDFFDISYVGRLWCLEFNPNIEQFLVVTIFNMAAEFKHCPISSNCDMWVDNDVPNWFPTLKNFYRSPFSKWPSQYANIQHSSISKVAFDLFVKPVASGRFGRLETS
jgi:hypothetical protein